MSKPFNWLRRDLDLALSLVQLTDLERRLMALARFLSYGAAQLHGRETDPRPFRFHFGRIVQDLGGSRRGYQYAARRLIRDRMLVEDDDGWLTINKVFEQWTGRHELTSRQVACCLLAIHPQRLTHYGRIQPTSPDPGEDLASSDPRGGPDPLADAKLAILAGDRGSRDEAEPDAQRNGRDQERADQQPDPLPEPVSPPARKRPPAAPGARRDHFQASPKTGTDR